MAFLGLFLMAVAAGAVVVFFAEGSAASPTSVTILDRTLQTSQFEIFLAGAATAAVFLAGLLLMAAGLRRATAIRRDLRRARAIERTRVSRPEEESRTPRDRRAAGDDTPAAPSGRHAAPGGDRLVSDRRHDTR